MFANYCEQKHLGWQLQMDLPCPWVYGDGNTICAVRGCWWSRFRAGELGEIRLRENAEKYADIS